MSELVLAGVILSGAWTQLDEIGWMGWAPLVLVALLDHFYPSAARPVTRPPLPRHRDRSATIAATALCVLLVAHLALTFREEFGFGGDEGYHLSATRAFAIYFMRAGPMLVAVLGGYAFLRFKRIPYAATIGAATLTGASVLLPASPLFGRYPTAFYLIATPLNVVFDALHSPYPYAANHIVNTLSLPAWLFVLRPLIIGRWPDWRVLPVAFLVYCQPLALVYLASPMLEPWAFVFILLALEVLAAYEPEDRWFALPLCAIAACFKETAILLMPFMWLVACRSFRKHDVAIGVASVAPFLIYFAVRRGLHIQRDFIVADAGAIWAQTRITEWITNLRMQVGLGGLIAVGLATLAGLRYGALWVIAALALALFFFVDAVSMPWTGYGRFAAYSLLAICGAVFATTYRVRDRRVLIAVSAVILLLQLPLTARTLSFDFGPDFERNSLEWNGSLIRFPFRQLASTLPDNVRRLRVVAFATDLISLPVAYPDLAARYTIETSSDCACRTNDQAVIAGFEWPAHLGNTYEARQYFNRVSAACVSELEKTCARLQTVRGRSEAIVGAAGVGVP